jgi:hypothetical protein
MIREKSTWDNLKKIRLIFKSLIKIKEESTCFDKN